jgi:hypothetical protein
MRTVNAVEESNLPHEVDVVDFDCALDDALYEEIAGYRGFFIGAASKMRSM